MDERRPILVVSPVPFGPWGGIERYLDEILKRWPEGGAVLLAPPRTPRYGPSHSWAARLLCQCMTFLHTLRIALRDRPRVILQGHVVFAWQARLLRPFLRIPYAVIVYGTELTEGRGLGLKRRWLQAADLVIADSRDTERLLRNLGVHGPTAVAYPGVDAARFTDGPGADALRRRWGLSGKRVLLTVARLAAQDRYKGQDLTMRAMILLKDRFPDLAYLIVGEGDDRPRLEALARELGLADRVVFSGRLGEADLPAAYGLCEVFVMPSRGEGFGIAYVEAQAAGRPVLALRRGGAPEAMHEGETGLLIDREDPGELAGALTALLADPARARAMGEAGRAFAGRFSWDRAAEAVREALRNLEPEGRRQVLLLNPAAILGGGEGFLLDLLAHWDHERFRALLVCPEEGPLLARARSLGAETRVLGLPRWVLRVGRERHPLNALLSIPALLFHFAYGIRLAWALRHRRIDLIHTHGNKAHLWGWAFSRLRRVRLVWQLNDFPRGLSGSLLRKLAGGADALVAISRAIADAYGRPASLIPNGVDLSRFAPGGPAADLGLPPGAPRIGIVGILAPWKGHEIFLEAARGILQARPDAVFVIVGDEAYRTFGHQGWRDRLERLSQALGISRSVRFLGAREDVPGILRGLDLLVHASLRPEPFGRVLVEAQACGLPVVASNAGGVPEIVLDAGTGLLVPPGDPGALAAAILALIGDPARRRAMGEAGIRRAREHYDAGLVSRRIFDLYAGLPA